MSDNGLVLLLQRLKQLLEKQRDALIRRDVGTVAALSQNCATICLQLKNKSAEFALLAKEKNTPGSQEVINLAADIRCLQEQNSQSLQQLSAGCDALINYCDEAFCIYEKSTEVIGRHRCRSLLKV